MATPPSSQFAALLRRSKFASYDPHIGQVYTTYDGYAARGNFGLKRPLALRRRNAHITVQAVDSREQQTVWRSAEPQNRWIRMWDETGATPTYIDSKSPWLARLGRFGEITNSVDSELVPQEKKVAARTGVESQEALEEEEEEEELKRSTATRNLEAMSDEQFDWYLRRIRELRPAFRDYLKKYGKLSQGADADSASQDTPLFLRSLNAPDSEFRSFLEHRAYIDYHAPRPRYIEQQPDRYGGLTYARAPPLQTRLLHKPHVGRVISVNVADKTAVVSTAGMTSTVPAGKHGDTLPAVSTFRFTSVTLYDAPHTVGERPEGLEGVKLRTLVAIDSDAERQKKPNPYRPGSKEYIAHSEAFTPHTGMTQPPPAPKVQPNMDPKHTFAPGALLKSLKNLREGNGWR